MRFSNTDKWGELFNFDPSGIKSEECKRLIAGKIREMCNDLNQRADRRDIAQGLRRLEQVGQLLEEHHWLQEEL